MYVDIHICIWRPETAKKHQLRPMELGLRSVPPGDCRAGAEVVGPVPWVTPGWLTEVLWAIVNMAVFTNEGPFKRGLGLI